MTALLVAALIAVGLVTVALSFRAASARKSGVRAAQESVFAAATTARLDAELRAAIAEMAVRDEILSSLDEGVLLAGEQGAIIYANPTAHRIMGVSAGDQIPPALTEAGEREMTLHHPARRIARAVTVPMPDGRRIVAVRDVTELRRVESMRRDFVGDASHELKTPVAAILATAETLQSAAKDDPAAVTRFTETLVLEARRLSRLVQDLLDLARLEQQARPDDPVDFSVVVRRECELADSRAAQKQLEIVATVEPGVTVCGSEQDLALAVRNLLDNAVRYTSRGVVSVTLHAGDAADGRCRLTVQDAGRGIPAKDLPRIFERFYRVDEARARDTGGTGLGLAIVKHVAERHLGSVEATSELGLGSTFTLHLPSAR